MAAGTRAIAHIVDSARVVLARLTCLTIESEHTARLVMFSQIQLFDSGRYRSDPPGGGRGEVRPRILYPIYNVVSM